jgi:hypothetical protein
MPKSEKLQADVQREFQQAGFEVTQSGTETFEVKKNGFTRRIEPGRNGLWFPAGPSLFNVRGVNCELEDQGYQKFWYINGRRFPAHLKELKALHQFDQELRYILGLKSLYHESLGTTSARTIYDRVEGRPADIQ